MNNLAYFEIQVDDLERAITFYSAVFDWKFSKDTTIPIDYFRIEGAGVYGGLLKSPAPVPAPHNRTNAFVCSIQVENFDEAADKITQHGGQIALPKFAVVGKCWQGYFLDLEENTFGIFQVDESAK